MKMLTTLIAVMSLLVISGCSTTSNSKSEGPSKKVVHQEHESPKQCKMYDKHCALSVSNGDLEVMGKDAHKFEHDGHTYYFSDEESMALFKKDLNGNIERANDNWGAFKWNQFQSN